MALQNFLMSVTHHSNKPLPTPTQSLTGADVQTVGQSLDHKVFDNTRLMSASVWHSVEAWTQARGNLSLPATPALVAAYLAHLGKERHLSVATVRFHKAHGHPAPTDEEGVR